MIIICVKIVNEIASFLEGNVVNPVVSEEFHDFLGTHELVTRFPVEALECDIGTADEGALILVKLGEALP